MPYNFVFSLLRGILPKALLALAAFPLFFACLSYPRGTPPNVQRLVQNAVFEVVVKKPPETGLVYETPPDFSALPYSVRVDEYAPLGTAFAVSPTDAVTAFHVLNPASKSLVYDTFYLRSRAGGAVYEIEVLTRASNEMDFVFFTVKGLTFKNYFQIETNFQTGDYIFCAGNANGEGIVTRSGAVLGATPEESAGRWRNIKTDAPANPGNSGGPLISKNGKALGIVSYIKENIVYAVPFSAIKTFPPDTLRYSLALDYGHILLEARTRRVFETEIALPMPFAQVRGIIAERYKREYEEAMTALFESAIADSFNAQTENHALNAPPDTLFPQIEIYPQNKNAGAENRFAALNISSISAQAGLTLLRAEAGPFEIWRFIDRRSVNENALFYNKESSGLAHSALDALLQAVRIERTLHDSAGKAKTSRILSFGEPFFVEEHLDSLGRLWAEARFLLPFDDRVFIAFVHPEPGGAVMLTAFCPSAAAEIFAFDIKKTLCHLFFAYCATFERWNAFQPEGKWTPLFLQDMSFQWEAGIAALQTPQAALRLGAQVFEWQPFSEFFVSPSWQINEGALSYSPQKFIFDKGGGSKDYFVLYRNNKPENPALLNLWNSIVERAVPFDEALVYPQAGLAACGTVLVPDVPHEDVLWTLYIETSRPALTAGSDIKIRLNALKAGIRIK